MLEVSIRDVSKTEILYMSALKPRSPRNLASALSKLSKAESGNVLMLFALAAVPLIGLSGLGIEYTRALYFRTQLDRAMDAATVTAIATARDYISTNPKSESDPTNSAKQLAEARGLATFRVNAGSLLSQLSVLPRLTVSRTGGLISATGSYETSYASAFGRLLGNTADIQISNKSLSSLTLGSFADFYLLLDTSGSMGFPTSSAAQIQFAKLNPDDKDKSGNNCAFACHFPGYKGFDISKKYNIELRIKTVSDSVQKLISKASSNQTFENQYRIGLYPFISYLEAAAEITRDFKSLASINLEDYMDIGSAKVPRGSGGTHYDNILPAINKKVLNAGDGSSAQKPQAFVFLITDGMANGQYYNNGFDGSQPNLLDNSLCKPLKDRGITISVLYIPYVPLAKPFNTNVGDENNTVNNLIPSVPNRLKSCASSGFFRTASSATEIQEAMNAMFDQATRKARLVDSL